MLRRTKAGRVTVLPGAAELLAEVAAAGLPYALVTGSLRPFVEAVLAATGFRFPVTVCGDDVPVTKPDPAPYQLAAKLLDVEPARCVALEDSPNGVASATAAGCLVVAVPSFVRRSGRPRPPRRRLAVRRHPRHPARPRVRERANGGKRDAPIAVDVPRTTRDMSRWREQGGVS